MSNIGMEQHDWPTFEYQDKGDADGPSFWWTNPFTDTREKIASLLWPHHPAEKTEAVEALFENLHLTFSSAPFQPAPVVADDLREAAIRDRAYVLGMKQALREVWPFIRENDRWWDALAKKLKELDARTDTLDKGALRILLDSTSPQPDRESERIATIKECTEWYDAHGWEMDPMNVSSEMKRALTSSNRPQATEEGK